MKELSIDDKYFLDAMEDLIMKEDISMDEYKKLLGKFSKVVEQRAEEMKHKLRESYIEKIDQHELLIEELADQLEQSKCKIKHLFSINKPYYIYVHKVSCLGCSPEDAVNIAVSSFRLAGFDPDKYNFDVMAPKYSTKYTVTITKNDKV